MFVSYKTIVAMHNGSARGTSSRERGIRTTKRPSVDTGGEIGGTTVIITDRLSARSVAAHTRLMPSPPSSRSMAYAAASAARRQRLNGSELPVQLRQLQGNPWVARRMS
jgi:hypothetical protein